MTEEQTKLVARCTEHLQAVEASTDWADVAEILWWYCTDVKELLSALLPQPAERPAQVAAIIEAELKRWYDESPTGTVLVMGYRDQLRKFAERFAAALASPPVE